MNNDLKQLGAATEYRFDDPSHKILERFPFVKYLAAETVTHQTSEFTSLCPKTSQPDFADVTIEFIPEAWCVETKSLKLYLFSFRNHGCFMEDITKQVFDDLAYLLSPRWLKVTFAFGARGGIGTTCKIERDWRTQGGR